MQHRHKEEHHGPEQAGPAYLNLSGDAQRCGDQRKADEIHPKQTPLHGRRPQVQQELFVGKMFCAEGRQRDGEAQVGQGYHLVDATSLGDIVLRGQQLMTSSARPAVDIEKAVLRYSRNTARIVACVDASNSTTKLGSRPRYPL